MSRPVCHVCGGRGGFRMSTGWVRCSTCQPRQSRPEARQAALHRYITGNRNELAYRACINLGLSEFEIAQAVKQYEGSYQPKLEGLQ